MADSSTKTKTVSIRLPNKELGQVDAYALAHDLNRSQAMLEILRKGLGSDAASSSAADAKLDAIAAKLDGIASAQGELKAQQLAQATVIVDAVKNQPIAVQQQLPAAEPAGSEPRKGLLGRLFG